MNDCRIDFDIKDVERMIRMLNKLGKSPQKAVNRAASKGGTIVKRAIRQGTVPVGETGNLKKAIIRKAEHSKLRGKKVYEVTFDKKYNDVLQKPIKNPGEAGGKSEHAYYPASQEYGFLTRSKGNGVTYVPGYHFMRKGAEQAAPEATKAMINKAMEELEKIWTEATTGG